MALNFCGFYSVLRFFFGFFPPKKHYRKKISRKNLLHSGYFDGRCGTESDSADEEEYCLENENTIDNPVDNGSRLAVPIAAITIFHQFS